MEEIKKLKQWCKPGTKIYTNVTHVSKSGMSRSISAFIVIKKEIVKIDYFLSKIGLGKIDQKNGGVKVYGCGMDMGFDLVYRLSYAIHKKDKNISENEKGTPVRPSKEKYRRGYSLTQHWL